MRHQIMLSGLRTIVSSFLFLILTFYASEMATAQGGLTGSGSISGVVTNASDSQPLADVEVDLQIHFSGGGLHLARVITGPDGKFLFKELPTGNYIIRANKKRFFFYTSCSRCFNQSGSCQCGDQSIVLNAGQVIKDFNIGLRMGGIIEANISVPDSLPEEQIGSVYLFKGDGSRIGTVDTELFTEGLKRKYVFTTLPSGEYYVRTSGYRGVTNELFDNVKCGNCDFSKGKKLVVTEGQITSVDLKLDYPETSSYSIDLLQGWNFISFPLQPGNKTSKNISDVLGDVAGKVRVIYGVDDKSGQYIAFVPGDNKSKLSSLSAGKGYWVFMNQPATLNIKGYLAIQKLQLQVGWNLVGFSRLSKFAVSEIMKAGGPITLIYAYDPGKNVYVGASLDSGLNQLKEIEPGKAYWVLATQNQTIPLPSKTSSTLAAPHLGISSPMSINIWISWVDKSDEELGYRVEMKVGDGPFEEYLLANKDQTVIPVLKMTSGEPKTYTFRIRATDGKTESPYSNEVTHVPCSEPGCGRH
jgi:hypothetical protein